MKWVVMALLIIYGLSAATTMTGFGDSDELIAAGFSLSLPHPPGYPLLTLILSIVTHLPGLNPAWWSHLLAAVIMAVTVSVLVTMISGKNWQLSVLAGLIVGGSKLIWEHGIHLEVFGLLGLLAVLLTKRSLECKYDWWWGVVAGLGLGHHQLFLLVLLPQLIWGWRRINMKVILGLGAGLLFSLLLLWALGSRQTLDSWRFEPNLSGLVKFYFRQDYSGYSMEVGQMKAYVSDVSLGSVIHAWVNYAKLMGSYWGLGLVLGILGLIWSKNKLVKCIFLCTGPVLVGYLGAPAEVLSQAIVERMYVLSQFFWGILTLDGLKLVAEKFGWKHWLTVGMGLCVVNIILVFPSRSLAKYTAAYEYTTQLFKDLPGNSSLICLSDLSCFGSYYYQTVMGQRADVKVMANAPQFRYLRQKYLGDENPFRLGEMIGRTTLTQSPIYVTQLNQVWASTLGLNGEAFDLVADGNRMQIVRQATESGKVNIGLEVSGPDYMYVKVLAEVVAEQERINQYLNQQSLVTEDKDVKLNFLASISQVRGNIKEELRLRQLAVWRKPDDMVTRSLLADAFSRAGLKDLADREYKIVKTLNK